MRIINKLQDYDFTIKYRPGIDNEAAYYLSRIISLKTDDNMKSSLVEELPAGQQVLIFKNKLREEEILSLCLS